MSNIGKAPWKNGKEYPVRFAVPMDSYGGELIFVSFMDKDGAVLTRREIDCNILTKVHELENQNVYVSKQAKDIMNKNTRKDSISHISEKKINTLSSQNTNKHVNQDCSLPDLTLDDLSVYVTEALSSETFDSRGEKYGYPLFERYEDRKRSGTDLEGIIPLLKNILVNKLPSNISINRECKYPHSNKRCDLVLRHISGKELWIELKLNWDKSCTPYETAFSTKDYIADIEKFNELPKETSKAIIQILFRPTPDFPDLPVSDINEILSNGPQKWSKFDMPTKKNGPCTCHIIIWLTNL